jgi:hypothetical protein
LIDQLQAYSKNVDPLYYTTGFIDGRRVDIKHAIVVQRPHNLDSICCLTLLQEETVAPGHKEVRKYDGSFGFKSNPRGVLPLPKPPVQTLGDNHTELKSGQVVPKSQSVKDKIAALSAYRMAKGLCKKCGENA